MQTGATNEETQKDLRLKPHTVRFVSISAAANRDQEVNIG
jgi:hypothetical protein